MGRKRIAVVHIPLSDQQKALIRSLTGADLHEVVMAGLVSQHESLENELTSETDRVLGEAIWHSNADFMRHMNNAYETKKAFEKQIGHQLDPQAPAIAALR